MRILTVHNYYQQAGGEDQVFADEADLLERQGHSVSRYTLHNDEINTAQTISLFRKTLWNQSVYRAVRSLIRQQHIQIAHFHNTFPLISPAAYYAAKAEGIPVIQTVHNYRLLCPNALFLRDGKVCEACLGKLVPLAGMRYGCYRGSQTASAAVAAMLTFHRMTKTWNNQVDRYIALTDFAREKFIQGGLPADKIAVKPNFVDPDPGFGTGQGGYALFVGRLAPEKGIDLLLQAWERLGTKIPLKIVGDGPLAPQVAAATRSPSIEWLGRKPMAEVHALLQQAMFLVFPSLWYEGLPRTLIESLAAGTPIIAPNLGSMSSLVIPNQTGFHFHPGSVEALATKVEWAFTHVDRLASMRHQVRDDFEAKYTAKQSYQQLMEIYAQAQRVQVRPQAAPSKKVVAQGAD